LRIPPPLTSQEPITVSFCGKESDKRCLTSDYDLKKKMFFLRGVGCDPRLDASSPLFVVDKEDHSHPQLATLFYKFGFS